MTKRPYTGPWRRIRATILERDNHLCQIQSPGCTKLATQVDHIVPTLQGGAWYDPANLRASCAHCNNQRVDRKREESWRTADTHITLVVGPPGGGHLDLIEQHRRVGDVVIDYDSLAAVIGAHNHEAVMAARNALLRQVRQGSLKTPRVWIVSTNPDAEDMFPYHRVMTVDCDRPTAHTRVTEGQHALVDRWFARREERNNRKESSRDW